MENNHFGAWLILAVCVLFLGIIIYYQLQEMDTFVGNVSPSGTLTIDPTECKFVDTDNGAKNIYCK